MTAMTEPYRVRYVEHEDGYNWHILDTDGEAEDSFKTRVEAYNAAKRMNEQVEMEAIKASIAEAMDDDILDLASLRKMAAVMRGD